MLYCTVPTSGIYMKIKSSTAYAVFTMWSSAIGGVNVKDNKAELNEHLCVCVCVCEPGKNLINVSPRCFYIIIHTHLTFEVST